MIKLSFAIIFNKVNQLHYCILHFNGSDNIDDADIDDDTNLPNVSTDNLLIESTSDNSNVTLTNLSQSPPKVVFVVGSDDDNTQQKMSFAEVVSHSTTKDDEIKTSDNNDDENN